MSGYRSLMHKVYDGARIRDSKRNLCIDVIVTSISGPTLHRKVDLKIISVIEPRSATLVYGEMGVQLEGGEITVELSKKVIRRQGKQVRLNYYATSDWSIYSRKYNPDGTIKPRKQ
ncbi:MAG: hypothetical protein QGF74_03470 [Candidatus Nanoarchaeia archaeon]|jgi:hypothetical protein|nr:hypothetical protein [Candidatus Nanoarchaeia archaeon]|tara:strand:+ start:44982 stop:45329 length:348 start_codon:yes stop_codon:yes gene_type:complete